MVGALLVEKEVDDSERETVSPDYISCGELESKNARLHTDTEV